jgi:hypothetical protein
MYKSQENYQTLFKIPVIEVKNRLFEADIPASINYLNENFANMSIMVIMKQEVQSTLIFLNKGWS